MVSLLVFVFRNDCLCLLSCWLCFIVGYCCFCVCFGVLVFVFCLLDYCSDLVGLNFCFVRLVFCFEFLWSCLTDYVGGCCDCFILFIWICCWFVVFVVWGAYGWWLDVLNCGCGCLLLMFADWRLFWFSWWLW